MLKVNNLLLLLTLILLSSCANYTKYNHPISTGARCSDGSPSSLLYHEGASKSKILIYFVGGGFCSGTNLNSILQSCYERASTISGTSYVIPHEMNLDSLGILSTKESLNPLYYDWVKVVVPYCDGSFHQGSRAEPINYKNVSLYFRGTNNTLAHFNYLNQTWGLFDAERVVVTGESAGGIATFIWTDYIYERSKNKQVYSMPDSGLFLTNYPNPKSGEPILQPRIAALFNLVNSEVPVPLTDCFSETHDNLYCMNFSASYKYFKAPLFIIESAYDEYSLSVVLTQRCLTQSSHGAYSLDKCNTTSLQQITKYRNSTLQSINNFTSLQKIGVWVPACVQHGFSHEQGVWSGAGYKIPTGDGVTLPKAIEGFMKDAGNKAANWHVDEVQWPGNKGCSGHVGGIGRGLRRISEEFEKLLKLY